MPGKRPLMAEHCDHCKCKACNLLKVPPSAVPQLAPLCLLRARLAALGGSALPG